jgi:hypothetical protein
MKHKITDEIVTDITIKEWVKYFNNTPVKPFEKIKLDSLVSVKQIQKIRKEILNKTKPF